MVWLLLVIQIKLLEKMKAHDYKIIFIHTYIHLILIITISLTHVMLIFPLCLKRKSRNNVSSLQLDKKTPKEKRFDG
jgi:hypothetical protein